MLTLTQHFEQIAGILLALFLSSLIGLERHRWHDLCSPHGGLQVWL